MLDPADNIRIVNLAGEEIVLDPKKLQFNDASLSQFMEQTSVWYDYFSSKSAKAEELLVDAETKYADLYLAKYNEGKQTGTSDKGADAYARVDYSVKTVQNEVNHYKSAVKQLKEYLKSFDKAFAMAQNRGYMLRKEMDKLNGDIYRTRENPIDISDIIGPEKEKEDKDKEKEDD